MIWSIGLSVLEQLWVLRDFSLRAGVFWHAPTSIAHVSSPLLITGLHLATLDLVREFAVVSMVLECGHKLTLIEERSPISEPLFDRPAIVLHKEKSTEPSVLSVHEG